GALRAADDYYVTEDTIEGIVWDSSNHCTTANIAGVRAPLLIMGMGAHYFLVPSEMFFERSPSADKTMAVVEGATHGFQPFHPAEPTPGAFGDTVRTTFDYLA